MSDFIGTRGRYSQGEFILKKKSFLDNRIDWNCCVASTVLIVVGRLIRRRTDYINCKYKCATYLIDSIILCDTATE